jgi:hypothetical protein
MQTLTVGPRDLIVLKVDDWDDASVNEVVQTLHKYFPENMILFLGQDETIETRSEEEAKELLKAIADHQEYREHKAFSDALEEG